MLALAITAAYAVPLPARLSERPSTVVEWSDGNAAHVFVAPDGRWRIGATLDQVDPEYVTALVRLEDRRFWWHPGVDPLAIARAAATNLAKGRRVSGASTITMQLVRVLEPRPRTLRSKCVEALRAMQLELRLSKKEILRAYLSFAPYGRNVEGVPAASLAYFGHDARALSPAEIATLLAVPQNPAARAPSPANAKRLAVARDRIAKKLLAANALPLGDASAELVLESIRANPAPSVLRAFPREAPHAAVWVRAKNPGVERIATTLDRGTQRLAERTILAHRDDLSAKGVWNGSTVIVDHATGEIRALVGNFDFWDSAHGGQIAGFAEPRSPGSTLKPFLYALAIDQGIAGEAWLVSDVPSSFGGYVPKNYDGEFSGVVRLDDALSRSLNLPFVALLKDVGVPRFLGTLYASGATNLGDPGRYGLSAAVGGVEVTPLELAALYAMLAQDGRARPLSIAPYMQREPVAILSPGASWLTRSVLERKDRPDFPRRREAGRLPPRVHWKTGTSFGHRDALAAGSGAKHTVVVWLGNFDYSSSSALVGADAAGPILFDLLEGLEPRASGVRDTQAPPDLALIEVCEWSGRLPGGACPKRAVAWAPKRRVPTATCGYHVAIDVEVKTGLALTPSCRAGREYETRSFAVLPASVRRWMGDRGRTAAKLPSLAPGCASVSRKAPAILSPGRGETLLLIEGIPWENQQVTLEAEAASTLSWFVDGEFIGTSEAEERLWWKPSPGRHEIVVADESGTTTKRILDVRTRPGAL